MRKLYALFLSVVFLAFAVSGCGSEPSPTGTPVAPTATSAPPTPTQASTPIATSAPPTPTQASTPTTPPEPEEQAKPFELTSTAFDPGNPIPSKYTCDGEDISPPLRWSDPPQGTQSFALFADDPDADGWIHWVLYNLPAEARTLPEAIPPDAELSDGSLHGKNSWGRLDYGGPCPPSGAHHYSFTLYALDTVLALAAGAGKGQLFEAMEGHILAQTELIGVYTRQ
jgi:Raf kinase inhibitor-like YbhB/YbcL family protein